MKLPNLGTVSYVATKLRNWASEARLAIVTPASDDTQALEGVALVRSSYHEKAKFMDEIPSSIHGSRVIGLKVYLHGRVRVDIVLVIA